MKKPASSLVLFLLLTALVVLPKLTSGCASKSGGGGESKPEEFNEDYDDEEDSGESEQDDEEDETVDDIALDQEDFDLMCDLFEAPNREKRLPDFIIIGTKKGGTRALIEFLKLHPAIKAAGPEIHFFDNHFEKGLDWYISQMPSVAQGQVATEKTPGYFHTKGVPAKIRAMNPDLKMLLIIRDPVKRLVSDYNQFRTKNLDAGKDYPALEDLVFDSNGQIIETYPPLQRSLYAKHMKRWLKYFPREQILIVNGDQFIKKPWIETQKVEQYLGIDRVITESNFFFNNTKGFYCGRDIREQGVWTCEKKKCLSKTKGRPKPPLLQGTEKKLRDYLRPFNAQFESLVNMTFGWP